MRISAEEIIERLNSMVAVDPDAMLRLIKQRVPCNEALADHPTCQVDFDEDRGPAGVYVVGLLGVLNGILGKDSEGWGYLCAVLDEDQTKLTGFKVTPQYSGEK